MTTPTATPATAAERTVVDQPVYIMAKAIGHKYEWVECQVSKGSLIPITFGAHISEVAPASDFIPREEHEKEEALLLQSLADKQEEIERLLANKGQGRGFKQIGYTYKFNNSGALEHQYFSFDRVIDQKWLATCTNVEAVPVYVADHSGDATDMVPGECTDCDGEGEHYTPNGMTATTPCERCGGDGSVPAVEPVGYANQYKDGSWSRVYSNRDDAMKGGSFYDGKLQTCVPLFDHPSPVAGAAVEAEPIIKKAIQAIIDWNAGVMDHTKKHAEDRLRQCWQDLTALLAEVKP